MKEENPCGFSTLFCHNARNVGAYLNNAPLDPPGFQFNDFRFHRIPLANILYIYQIIRKNLTTVNKKIIKSTNCRNKICKHLIIASEVNVMIGERLAELRKNKKLSQKELAEKLKISTYTVSSYEREKSTPDDEMKVKIARLFNISLDYLLGLINEELPIGGGKTLHIPEYFPPEAIREIREYVNYTSTKYANKQ